MSGCPHRGDGRRAVARRSDLPLHLRPHRRRAAQGALRADGGRATPTGAVAAFYRSFPAHSFEPSDLALFHRTVEDLRSFVLDPGRRVRERRQHAEPARDLARPRPRRDPAGSLGRRRRARRRQRRRELLVRGLDDRLVPARAGRPASRRSRARARAASARTSIPSRPVVPSSIASSGKACCRPASRATTSRPCTWWAPRWPRCSCPTRARALAGSSRGRRATSSRSPLETRLLGADGMTVQVGERLDGRPTWSPSPAARPSRSATTRAPGSRRRVRSSTPPWRAARRSTASRPGSARSPTPGSSRRRPRRCSTASCARTRRPWARRCSREEARAMLLLRAHVLALGHSGVRPERRRSDGRRC